MAKKKLLLFGNANHQFNINYVRWLRSNDENLRIDILADRPVKEKVRSVYDLVYEINFKSLFFKIIKQVPFLSNIYTKIVLKQNIKEISQYDYIHIQILNLHAAYFALYASKYSEADLIISIWGSDYYKHSKKHRRLFKNSCLIANKITFTNEQTRDHFKKNFNWKKNNIFICRFGLMPLEGLKRIQHKKREDAKKFLNWDLTRIAITVGYNMSPNQQHLKILDEFLKIEKFVDKVELILPITYGGDKKYKNELLSVLKGLPFKYRIYDQFLSDEMVAHIRWASDIMIQLQITDQFSGSMLEHLYARNVVITGSWLPYKTMIDHHIEFNQLEKVEMLSVVLEDILIQYDSYYKNTDRNPEAVLELGSWDKNISHWIKLYN